MESRQQGPEGDVEDGGGLLARETVQYGEQERQSERRWDRTEDCPHVVVPEQAEEVEVELVRVRKGILDGDRLEQGEVI